MEDQAQAQDQQDTPPVRGEVSALGQFVLRLGALEAQIERLLGQLAQLPTSLTPPAEAPPPQPTPEVEALPRLTPPPHVPLMATTLTGMHQDHDAGTGPLLVA